MREKRAVLRLNHRIRTAQIWSLIQTREGRIRLRITFGVTISRTK